MAGTVWADNRHLFDEDEIPVRFQPPELSGIEITQAPLTIAAWGEGLWKVVFEWGNGKSVNWIRGGVDWTSPEGRAFVESIKAHVAAARALQENGT